MPQKVILHVGPHKTGSTALQKLFTQQRNQLAEVGISYPKSGIMDFGHHVIVEECRERFGSFNLDDLKAETQGFHTVLLSSENFTVLSAHDIEKMFHFFPHASIEIIYYLRNLCDLWPSHWQEIVKHGQSISFAEYVMQASFGWKETGWSALNQLDQLSKLKRAFGQTSIRIVGYDFLAKNNVDIGANFWKDFLGLSPECRKLKAPIVNVSLKDWQLELIRLMNKIHFENDAGPANGDLRAAVLRNLEECTPEWLESFKEQVAGARKVVVKSSGPVIDLLQRNLIQEFGQNIVGDPAATISEYLAPRQREVSMYEFPFLTGADMQAKLGQYYKDLTPLP